MKKIAIICQRYGLEVNGGAEYYARLISEKLSAIYQVEVLTSKALSYEKWENYYTNDEEKVNGVIVRRFTVREERNSLLMKILSNLIKRLHMNFRFLCDAWVRHQGPYVPDLVHYIKENKDRYDVFIFITYLYYPTVVGMQNVKDKAIFIPTAHDEPYIRFKSHKELFGMPKGIVYLTDEEKAFVEETFHNQEIPSVVAGVGIDLPLNVDANAFRDKYGIKEDYIIYVGRVDKSKGCGEMIKYFLKYHQQHPEIQLVIMGQAFMEISEHQSIHNLGFVSEEDKFNGIAGAKALWLPSQFESLSIAVLEAMSLAIPVLVNGKCEVLKGHCVKSEGGLYYMNYNTFVEAMEIMLYDDDKYVTLKENAKAYIQENYLWSQIITKIETLIEGIET